MFSLKEIIKAPRVEVEFPMGYYSRSIREDFCALDNLYVNNNVTVGYRGHVIRVSLSFSEIINPYLPLTSFDLTRKVRRYHVFLQDAISERFLGDGVFDCYDSSHLMYKVRKEVIKAICKYYMESTDFYE